jgi:hypothetical protein
VIEYLVTPPSKMYWITHIGIVLVFWRADYRSSLLE